jgi:hypothetical protein
MPGAGGLTASNWFEDLTKPDGLTLYYCVGSTAVTQQAFGLEGVTSAQLGNARQRRPSDFRGIAAARQGGAAYRQRPAAARHRRAHGRRRLEHIPSLGCRVSQLERALDSGYQGGGELRLAFEHGETDLYAPANLLTLRELMAAGFRPFTQQGSLTSSGSFRRRPEFKDVPTFDEMLGKRRPTGDAWAAYVT